MRKKYGELFCVDWAALADQVEIFGDPSDTLQGRLEIALLPCQSGTDSKESVDCRNTTKEEKQEILRQSQVLFWSNRGLLN